MSKILLVMNDTSNRSSLASFIKAQGFEVIEAGDGQRALQLLQMSKIILVVCGLTKSHYLEAYTVLIRMRSSPSTALTPFILIADEASSTEQHFVMQLGANAYLSGPLALDSFLEIIYSQLASSRMVSEIATRRILEQTEENLNYLLHYDLSTQLPNRMLLREQFEQQVFSHPYLSSPTLLPSASFISHQSELTPLLYLNFDRFDRVLENFELSSISKLLQAVYRRILHEVKGVASMTQLGPGHCAIILVPPGRYHKFTSDIAQQILEVVTAPTTLGIEGKTCQKIRLTASVGIAFYPCDGTDLQTLLLKAQTASKMAQNLGGNQHQFYVSSLNSVRETELRMGLEVALSQALERHELELYYQPQLSLVTNQLCGIEVFLRWHHPQMGMLRAGEFMAAAEESGLILPIGEWVLKTACTQFRLWQSKKILPADFRMAINLTSLSQLQQPYMSQRIAQILSESGLDSGNLELEFSENSVMYDAVAAGKVLAQLKDLGIRLIIDNYGRGYSSLAHLEQFPFDGVKLDQSLVRKLKGQNADSFENMAVTLATIQLAHHSNLEISAQGVESEEELAFLVSQGCSKIQGYVYQPPLSLNEFETLLESGISSPNTSG
jgi:EAL domain-containing protein (putative c-di-GMP-specific phosphodiesterase class I)/GGDEF domain-containing protein